jgi:hypothetical protein
MSEAGALAVGALQTKWLCSIALLLFLLSHHEHTASIAALC